MVQKLTQKDESLCLEFKSYWYWPDSKNKQKGENEFLKDFISLFNTYDKNQPRHIVFGYDEKTKSYNNYYEHIDRKGIKSSISNIQKIDYLKEFLIKHLEKTCYFLDLESNSIPSAKLDDFFELEVQSVSDKEILLLTIHPAPFYFMLKRDLSDGLKENTVPIRCIDTKLSPKNAIASNDQISKLQRIIKKNHTSIVKQDQRSIEKIVYAFQSKHFPSATIKRKGESRKKSGIYYQLFQIHSELVPPQYFIYITAFSSQEKTISALTTQFKDDFKVHANIFILVDKENTLGGKIDLSRIEQIFNAKLNAFSNNKAKADYLEDFSRERIYKSELSEDIFALNPSIQNDFISPQLIDSQGCIVDSDFF